MSKIMAINAGSSSLKFQLFEMPSESVITKGIIERIGLPDSIFTISIKGENKKIVQEIPNHSEAVKMLLNELVESEIIHSFDELEGVGHRVVHGGEIFSDSAMITDETLKQIESLNELAPLHNPANIIGIRAFGEKLPNVPQVAVFDTAFHQTMPESAYLYSLPYEYYEKYGVRKYGFHGTSHQYVSVRAAAMLNRPVEELKLISCHLGNGASIAAIKGGESIETSMGFTPLAGLAMGTRSGNVDPALIPFIMKKAGKSAEEVIDIFNKQSGLLGITGFSSDLRDIEAAAEKGDKRAEMSLDIFTGRIQKYIGSYAARMRGVDGIIFTAGIGENSSVIRKRVLEGLEFMGVHCDEEANNMRGKEAFISTPDSSVKVMVIPTNEEVMIARDVLRIANI